MRRRLAGALICALIAGSGAARAADDYPNHGQYLAQKLGQQFIIENKPGAGNNLATEIAAHAPPDGYTIFLVNPANTINASLYKNLSFDFIRDMAPVAGFIRVPNVMEVNPAVPAKTVAEFIAYAKSNPGKINMASSGVGTSVHLSGALFMMMTGVNLVHVPYRGAAPALTDMLAGHVQVMFDNLPSSIAHIQAGRLRALAVTTATRAAALPNVPTVADTVPGYEASAFFGMAVPKGTPRPIIDKLNRTINQALADPALQARLAELGGTNIAGTPEDFGKIVVDETNKWTKVVKATGATAE
jgi:tripartite-type tricarboxylate transporter receptor subunit TctC